MSTEEKVKRFRLFKAPNGKYWSAELFFEDGSTETFKTEFDNQQKAAMSSSHRWRALAKEKGLYKGPATKPGRKPQGTPEAAPHTPVELIRAAREGGAVVPVNGHGTSHKVDSSSLVAALSTIITSISPLGRSERDWVLKVAADMP